MYGKYEYIAEDRARHLTLPSLYVLLWINFATFSLADVIRVSPAKKIDFVCEDPQKIQATCTKHLKDLWKHMTINLDFCDEHVSHLITECLAGIMKVYTSVLAVNDHNPQIYIFNKWYTCILYMYMTLL